MLEKKKGLPNFLVFGMFTVGALLLIICYHIKIYWLYLLIYCKFLFDLFKEIAAHMFNIIYFKK